MFKKFPDEKTIIHAAENKISQWEREKDTFIQRQEGYGRVKFVF